MMHRRVFLRRVGAAAAALGARAFPDAVAGQEDELDVVLRGGRVLDGTGSPPRPADVGIRGDRIAAMGELGGARARRRIDVDGLVVSPGFIDVHAHSEDELLVNPKAESKVRQGVTTELLGMDGDSYPPAGFTEALSRLRENGIALNVGTFVGQGTLRGLVMQMSDRPAGTAELRKMRAIAAEALAAGALGISSGLEYTPGGFASTSEITELCKVMSGTRGLYATHMRNEDDRVVEAVEEAIAIAEGASIGLHISHLKCQGKRNWNKADAIFDAIDRAEARGVSVTFDRYPYVAYSTNLSNLMPLWCREGGTERFLERLQSADDWPRIRREVEDKVALLGSWEQVMISSVHLEKNKTLQGKTVAEIVKELGEEDPYLFVRALLVEEKNEVGMLGFGMSEDTTARILAHPKCMPASDGSALADYGELRRGSPHPRSYGTFARVLGKYVREMKILPLEEAIRKMTSFPADRFGLSDRGRLSAGYLADVVVFDPGRVEDRATFAQPHQYAAGFELVMVNGRVVFQGGERTEELPGRVLLGDIAPARAEL